MSDTQAFILSWEYSEDITIFAVVLADDEQAVRTKVSKLICVPIDWTRTKICNPARFTSDQEVKDWLADIQKELSL